MNGRDRRREDLARRIPVRPFIVKRPALQQIIRAKGRLDISNIIIKLFYDISYHILPSTMPFVADPRRNCFALSVGNVRDGRTRCQK